MSLYEELIKTGELANYRIVKAIKLSNYEKNTVLAGVETNLLSSRQLIEILTGVGNKNYQEKDFLSEKIVKKIRLKGVSRKRKLLMIAESSHNKLLAKRVDKTINWSLMETKSVEEAVRDSDYNFYILISAIKTGKLSTKTRFESITKVTGNGKISFEIAKMVVEKNNWGRMDLKDCCMAIKLSGGDNYIAEAVIQKKMDLPKMLAKEMLDAIELSDQHGMILNSVRIELERRKEILQQEDA